MGHALFPKAIARATFQLFISLPINNNKKSIHSYNIDRLPPVLGQIYSSTHTLAPKNLLCPAVTGMISSIFLHFSYLDLPSKFIATFLIQDLTFSPIVHWAPNNFNSAVSLVSFNYPPPYNHAGLSKRKSKSISSLFKSFPGSLIPKYIDLIVVYTTVYNLACSNSNLVSHHLILKYF